MVAAVGLQIDREFDLHEPTKSGHLHIHRPTLLVGGLDPGVLCRVTTELLDAMVERREVRDYQGAVVFANLGRRLEVHESVGATGVEQQYRIPWATLVDAASVASSNADSNAQHAWVLLH